MDPPPAAHVAQSPRRRLLCCFGFRLGRSQKLERVEKGVPRRTGSAADPLTELGSLSLKEQQKRMEMALEGDAGSEWVRKASSKMEYSDIEALMSRDEEVKVTEKEKEKRI